MTDIIIERFNRSILENRRRYKVLLKVKNNSKVNKVAGAILGYIKENEKVEIQAIGAGAINQTIKAITVANIMGKDENINLVFTTCFAEAKIENEIRTAIKFIVIKNK